ncbi:MAG: TIGR00645 family protein [Hyphomicrobiaceae bacterium]
MPPLKKIIETLEHYGEQAIFASRWLLAPIYLGLALSLIVLLFMFVKELFHLATHMMSATETDVILGLLALVDMALTGSLMIIVIFSGYENFVSKIDHSGHADWPDWMGTIDFTALKLKLLSSIVAISAIQLLKEFMSIKVLTAADERKLFWLVVIHLVFVTSSVLLAASDWISSQSHGHGKANGEAEAALPPSAPTPAAGPATGKPVVRPKH